MGPDTLAFSLMTGCAVGSDQDDLARRVEAVMARTGDDGTPDEWLTRHRDDRLAGTVEEIVERLQAFEDAGVDRVMLQHLAHDDLEMVRLLGDIASQ